MSAPTRDWQLKDGGGPVGVDDWVAQVGPSQLQQTSWRSLGFEHLSAAGAILDGEGRIIATNAAWRLFATLNGGDDATTGEGLSYLETCARAVAGGSEVAQAVLAGLTEVLRGDRMGFDIEYPCPAPNQDRWFLLQATSAPVIDGAGVVLFHVDISARKVLEEGLAHLANHDPLTGLGNRVAARRALDEHLEACVGPLALVSFDLDGFKTVNDSFGHHIGDEVLVQVANRARKIFAGIGQVFRLGGDEFLAICPATTAGQAERLAAALREQMAVPFQVGRMAISIGASAGTSSSAEHAAAATILVAADERMYGDKRSRSGRTGDVDARPFGSSIEPPTLPPVTSWLAEAELRAMQATTDAVLAHATDLVLFFDVDGAIVWASPASERLFGVSPEDLVGRAGADLVHPDDRDRVFLDFLSIPCRGDSVRTEFRVTAPDGSVRWVEKVATNLLDDPDVGAVVGHIRDITDRKAAEQEVQFQARLLAAAGQAMVAQDPNGVVVYWNQAAEDLYGWTSAEALGRTTRVLVPPAPGWEDRANEVHRLLTEGTAWSGELTVTTKSNRTVPVLVTGTPVLDAEGRQSATILVSSDISERVARRVAADQDRQRFADAQASAGLGSFEIDLQTGEATRSDELWRILGRDPGTTDLALLETVHPDDHDAVRAVLDAVIAGTNDAAELTHRIVRPDGEIRWVISKTSQARGAPHRLAGTTLDVTERHLAELALAHQANHDALTGLANRRLLVSRIEASLGRNATTGRRTALMFIDLDDFKAVNDRIGHSGGDTILQAIGDLIDGVITPGDTVARLGGDEFVVCCEGVADIDDALGIVERIRTALAAPFRFRSETFAITASCGVVLSQPSSEAEALLRDADAAMYVAKQGNNPVEVFTDAMAEGALRRRTLVAELEGAVAEGQIHTWFQPEIDLRTGALIGFEALARWAHPERGIISPAEFIELAEDSGLINELGRQVLHDACAELARWMDRHPDRHLTVSVNVSPIQMASPGLADDVRAIIAATGVPAGRVCLEVTETSLMDGHLAAQALRSLKEVGVLIAIDDFGTGYSSLSRLKTFPVDFLKIDQSFVAGLGNDPEDELIVAAVTNLAHSMGIRTIAEGIETQHQLTMLTEMGCEFGQGYVWSKPMSAAEALAFAARTDLLSSQPPALPDSEPAPHRSPSGGAARMSASDSTALIVHELASPMTLSLAYSRLLPEMLDLAGNDEAIEAVDTIIKANEDMASIIRTLADVRPLEEGTLALERLTIDLVPLLVEVTNEIAVSGHAAPVQIGGAPSAHVFVDPIRVRQIFRNLLTNAQKWQTSCCWIELVTDEDRGRVTVSVFDDGPGVPAERVGDLFRRFARFDRSRIGTGLGLYLSRALARAHGGDIRYRRTDEGGSEFAVELALAPAPTP